MAGKLINLLVNVTVSEFLVPAWPGRTSTARRSNDCTVLSVFVFVFVSVAIAGSLTTTLPRAATFVAPRGDWKTPDR